MYTGLLHTHSSLRWIVLLLIAITGLKSLIGWMQKKEYQAIDNKLSLFTLIGTHTQILIGFGLYFTSSKVAYGNMANAMKDSLLRYYTVEHITMMLIVAVLITIGRSKTKKKEEAVDKFKTTAVFNLISLALILIAIYVMHP